MTREEISEEAGPTPPPKTALQMVGILFVLQFAVCGLLVIINAFKPFLSEEAFAILALILLGEFLVLWVVSMSMKVIGGLRSFAQRDPEKGK